MEGGEDIFVTVVAAVLEVTAHLVPAVSPPAPPPVTPPPEPVIAVKTTKEESFQELKPP